MANNMTDEQIEKIAQAIAAKIGEPGGPAILGCGSASNTQGYFCQSNPYNCNTSYECGGASYFYCGGSYGWFYCRGTFKCYSNYTCYSSVSCSGTYNP